MLRSKSFPLPPLDSANMLDSSWNLCKHFSPHSHLVQVVVQLIEVFRRSTVDIIPPVACEDLTVRNMERAVIVMLLPSGWKPSRLHKGNYPGARQSGSSGKPGAYWHLFATLAICKAHKKSLPLSPGSWPPGLHRSRPWYRCRRSWSWGWSRGWESPFQRFLALPGTSWSCVCLDEVSALKPECHPENILFGFPHNFRSSFYSPKISSQKFQNLPQGLPNISS